MPRDRFRSVHATPPCGYYEYSLDGETVTDRSRIAICQKVRDLRTRHGQPTVGDGFAYVMEYMCPAMPNGFCFKPSSIKVLRIHEVKEKTMTLFRKRCVTADEIERRMETCVACPQHTTRGFCLDCTGLLTWMYGGFGGRRGPLPADRATGACVVDEVLAAAGATVADWPVTPGASYPETCWRRGAEA